ncbi:calmodulin-binding receptor-like cytoplasmic kinase 2 [Impatiens glandulifera]|uniref:calmodulin-binding receptor-like cytoplasmic kinase 2 n=1 Tax=Impatiens glandulifera TaxID=253017 RepID=UPI001FB0F152|nr:calmodulin-binding receptor-like cytoplasmic kinase 2 [Impatiens glandulifera]
MSSWSSPFSSRASGGRSTPGRPPASSSSTSVYSSNSIISSSHSKKSNFTKNTVKNAAITFAGAFTNCFTAEKNSKDFDDSNDFGPPPSVKSDSTSGRSRRRGIYSSSNESTHTREAGSVKFTMTEIQKATRNFSPSLKIGQGGFGMVYKGQLADGTIVAVKRAKKVSYDNHLSVEFQSEIQTLSSIEHLNLVKCYGYLEHEDENERIIVMEYVSNGTLREHLDCIQKGVLDLNARLDICTDVAHAITYLHTYTDHPIIHRDIKSSNILLNENLRAKVSDFGFARLAADRDSCMTHVSTQVKGTAGYLDPEYLRTYQLTEKSDVYSFGVLLVEIMTGRRPIESKREFRERVTTRWAMKKLTDGDAIVTLDPNLEKNVVNNFAIEKIFELALLCLANTRRHRPTMQRCVEILWNIRRDSRALASSSTIVK